MNVAYLIEALGTNDLKEVVANIDLPPLDMNLAIWEAIDRGEVEVDEERGTIDVVLDPAPSSDADLKSKVLRVIQHYARENTNITRGRLNVYIKDPGTGEGYPWHEYVMVLQHLLDGELIEEEVIEVEEKRATVKNPETGKKEEQVVRPGHKFAFLGLAENGEKNAEWNRAAVDKWLADMEAAEAVAKQ